MTDKQKNKNQLYQILKEYYFCFVINIKVNF